MLRLGETLVDTLAYLAPYFAQGSYYQNGGAYLPVAQQQQANAMFDQSKQGMEAFIEKDLYDEEAVAKKLNAGLDPLVHSGVIDPEADSVLGEKSDALMQSAGQLAAQYGLSLVGVPWFITSGVSSFGSEVEGALQQGASMEEAGLSAAITAGAEILTEKLFSGDLFVKNAGFDGLVSKLTSGIADKFVRKAAQLGLDAAGEGAEEWLSQRIGQFGQWLSYRHDEKELLEMLYSEESLNEALEAFFGGVALGGGMGVAKTVVPNAAPQQSQSAPQNDVTAPGENGQAPQETPAEPRFDAVKHMQDLAALGAEADVARKPEGSAQSAFDNFEDILARGTNAPADPVGAAVEGFNQTGTVTNKQATDILSNSKAVQTLREQVGLDLPDTAAGRRNAIKEAVARLAQRQAETDNAQTTDLSEQSGTKERISMADFANQNSPVWRNVEYDDDATKISIMQDTHNAMVADGSVVKVTDETAEAVDQAYPDLRDVKKKERMPILKAAMTKLKNDLRQFLNGFKNQTFEFEVNGKVLDATLYNTGINEVLEKVTKEKANMLYSTEAIFRNARYLYSTPDYDGDPNVYRWNYFYTPVQIGSETVGVRIAVRDLAKQGESQIYNWGIKKGSIATPESEQTDSNTPKATGGTAPNNASLGGVRDDSGNRKPYGASSDASINSIPQTTPGVNTNSSQPTNPTESVGAAPSGFDPYSGLQYQHGNKPDRAGATRDINVPNKDTLGYRVSDYAANLYGHKITSNEMVSVLEQHIADGDFGAETKTLDATLEAAVKAVGALTERGNTDKAVAWVQDAISRGAYSDDLFAVAQVLYAQAEANLEFQRAADLAVMAADIARVGGRILNVAKLTARLTPDGQLAARLAMAENANRRKNETKAGRKSADVEILKFNNQLETIAKLIEAKAKTAEEAAEIVRDCKLKA